MCHGPNGLVNVKSSSGKHIVDGKNVTGFSNTEEEAVGKTNVSTEECQYSTLDVKSLAVLLLLAAVATGRRAGHGPCFRPIRVLRR